MVPVTVLSSHLLELNVPLQANFWRDGLISIKVSDEYVEPQKLFEIACLLEAVQGMEKPMIQTVTAILDTDWWDLMIRI